MTLTRPCPILRAMRMHIIRRLREMGIYQEQFDYNKIEWTANGVAENFTIQMKLTLDENRFWIYFRLSDGNSEASKEEVRIFMDDFLLPLGLEFNDQEQHFETFEWFMTYVLNFKHHNAGLLIEKVNLLGEKVSGKKGAHL